MTFTKSFYIFSLVKYIVVYFISNRIKETIRFTTFPEPHTHKNLYMIDMLNYPRVLLTTCNLHKTNYKKN